MYVIFEGDKFKGFSLKEESGYTNIEVTDEKHIELLECSNKSGVIAIINDEIVCAVSPSEYHEYDNETNEWVYRKELEMKALGIELLRLETELSAEYDARDKAVDRGLKALENALSISIGKLTEKLEENYVRLKELEGEQE